MQVADGDKGHDGIDEVRCQLSLPGYWEQSGSSSSSRSDGSRNEEETGSNEAVELGKTWKVQIILLDNPIDKVGVFRRGRSTLQLGNLLNLVGSVTSSLPLGQCSDIRHVINHT